MQHDYDLYYYKCMHLNETMLKGYMRNENENQTNVAYMSQTQTVMFCLYDKLCMLNVCIWRPCPRAFDKLELESVQVRIVHL